MSTYDIRIPLDARTAGAIRRPQARTPDVLAQAAAAARNSFAARPTGSPVSLTTRPAGPQDNATLEPLVQWNQGSPDQSAAPSARAQRAALPLRQSATVPTMPAASTHRPDGTPSTGSAAAPGAARHDSITVTELPETAGNPQDFAAGTDDSSSNSTEVALTGGVGESSALPASFAPPTAWSDNLAARPAAPIIHIGVLYAAMPAERALNELRRVE